MPSEYKSLRTDGAPPANNSGAMNDGVPTSGLLCWAWEARAAMPKSAIRTRP